MYTTGLLHNFTLLLHTRAFAKEQFIVPHGQTRTQNMAATADRFSDEGHDMMQIKSADKPGFHQILERFGTRSQRTSISEGHSFAVHCMCIYPRNCSTCSQ